MENDIQKQFDKIDQRFEKTDQKVDDVLQAVKAGFDDVYGRLDSVEGDVKSIKATIATMPTKEYIDDKLADLGAEIGKRINRAYEEQRLFAVKLVEFLKADGVLKKDHVEQLEEMLA